MKFWNRINIFNRKKVKIQNSRNEIPTKNEYSFEFDVKPDRKDSLIIDKSSESMYSEFPRYYIINGIRYDIDNPYDLKTLPLIRNVFEINGEQYGLDSLLNEHCIQSTANMDVHWAAYNKVQEYRGNGIIHRSAREIKRRREYEKAQEDRRIKEEARKHQCNLFMLDDMEQFSDIPFGWHLVKNMMHTDGVAWFTPNYKNRQIALKYISQIKELIDDSHSYIKGTSTFSIDIPEIDFGYPLHKSQNSMTNTRVECYPYTRTGKKSKYPAILIFATSKTEIMSNGEEWQMHPISGEIKIMQDGNIGYAKILFSKNHTSYTIGLYGLSLIIKKVYNDNGLVFSFSDIK